MTNQYILILLFPSAQFCSYQIHGSFYGDFIKTGSGCITESATNQKRIANEKPDYM